MEAMMAAMADNLTSKQADRFDQGCREAAALIDMLQNSSSFPASGSSSQLVIETLLASIGRILEESLKYPNDVARHHSLRSVAAALAQALVPTTATATTQNSGGEISSKTALNDEFRQNRSEMEKIINQNLPNGDVLDWDAAAVVSQTALLQAKSYNNTAAPLLPSPSSLGTLDSLLQLSLHVPSMDTISGAPSTLLKAAQHVPPPSFHTTKQHTNIAACTSYLTLHPQALQEHLAAVLAHTASKTTTKTTAIESIQASIESNAEWSASIDAIAASPALHLLARSTLRSWLAASGNIHVWLLHWHLFKLSRGSKTSESSRTFPEYVYPGNLRNTAECVYEACLSLESLTSQEKNDDASSSGTDMKLRALKATLQSIQKHSMNDELFSLILDGFELTKSALEQLVWTESIEKDDNNIDMVTDAECLDTTNKQYFKSPVPQEAAEWLSLAMWPFIAPQQQLLCDAMIHNINRGDDVAVEVKQSMSILQNIWCPVLLN